MLALPANEIHVWMCRLENEPAAASAGMLALLSSDERVRYCKYRFAKDRKHYLFAHCLARVALSAYAPVEAADWQFETGIHGKPFVTNSLEIPIGFNISHTQGLVACAISRIKEIGVDVENTCRAPIEEVERFFAPTEVAQLANTPPDCRVTRFFEFWTLKEAYMKARGLGMFLPLHDFSFRLDGEKTDFEADAAEISANWSFFRRRPTSHHQMAVAARNHVSEPWKLKLVDYTEPLHRRLLAQET